MSDEAELRERLRDVITKLEFVGTLKHGPRTAVINVGKLLDAIMPILAEREAKVRDAAIEECAKLCDARTNRNGRGGMGEILANTQNEEARQIAAALRSAQPKEKA